MMTSTETRALRTVPPTPQQVVVVSKQSQMNGLLEIYNREKRIAGRKAAEGRGRQYLIYSWRGWHDFLFFVSEDGRLVDHGWWFAYE